MRTEGILKVRVNATKLAAIFAVRGVLRQAARAQYMGPQLPDIEGGPEPISFMRPHYIIGVEAGTNLPTPPNSASRPRRFVTRTASITSPLRISTSSASA